MESPSVEVHPADGTVRGVALFCHGGTATSAARRLATRRCPWCGCAPSSGSSARPPADRGLTTQLLRYRVAGWNGDAADAFVDVRWAMERIREEHGTEVPIVLVGHSMGGRAALRAGGDAQVAAVCALAPWTPPGEPVAAPARADRRRSCTGAATAGCPPRCRPTSPVRARARPARTWPGSPSPAATRCCAVRTAGTPSSATSCSARTGIEPMRADVTNALRRPVPEGLAVPLWTATGQDCRTASSGPERSPARARAVPHPRHRHDRLRCARAGQARPVGRADRGERPLPAMRAWHPTLGTRDVVSGLAMIVAPPGGPAGGDDLPDRLRPQRRGRLRPRRPGCRAQGEGGRRRGRVRGAQRPLPAREPPVTAARLRRPRPPSSAPASPG